MSTPRLQLGPPSHGWLEVRLELDSPRSFAASDVPCDSLRTLAEATGAIADGLPARVRWSLEPSTEVWTFTPLADGEVQWVADDGTHDAGWRGSALVCARSLWRALRKAESSWPDDPDLRAWSWPFPHQPLRRAGATLSRPR